MRKRKSQEEKVMVYIGPTIKDVVEQNRAFQNGIPSKLEEVLEARPYIRRLIVPLDEMVASVKEIQTTGSALNVLYRKTLGE